MRALYLTISIILGSIIFPLKSQELSFSIPLDSANVINNALVQRTNGTSRQYVMMPTQYGTDINTGIPLIISIDQSLTGNCVNIIKFDTLPGMVVNDMAIGTDNTIFFGGYRNGKAVYGFIDTSNNIIALRDSTAPYCKSIAYKNYSGLDYLYTGSQWTSGKMNVTSFSKTGNILNAIDACYSVDDISLVDVVLSQHTTSPPAYGISIGRMNSRKMAVMLNKTNNLSTTTLSRRNVNLPQYWQWQVGGGSIVKISTDTYVTATDVRCDTAEKDGIWMVKLRVTGSSVNVIETRLIEFPTQKVVVNDLYVIEDKKRGYRLCLAGQYVEDNPSNLWCGCPFILQMDTNFTNERVKKFATHYYEYGMKNYTLNKMCYNASIGVLVAVGKYNRHPSYTAPGGIYLVTNNVFSNLTPLYSCVEDLDVNIKNVVRSYGMINGMIYTTPANEPVHSRPQDFLEVPIIEDCFPAILPEEKFVSEPSNQHCITTSGSLILQDISGQVDYIIYDMLGRTMSKGSASSSINIASLPKGIYIVRILQNNQIIATEKFTK